MRLQALAILAGLVLLGGVARAQSVALRGPTGETRSLSATDLAAMPHERASIVNEHGPAKIYEGVPLTLLLQSVGAPAGKTLRGPAVGDVVVVGASDGYRVALALAETDAGVRSNKVLLADRADGAPLPLGEGPFRLVVEGDLKPMRSARMVTSITVEPAP